MLVRACTAEALGPRSRRSVVPAQDYGVSPGVYAFPGAVIRELEDANTHCHLLFPGLCRQKTCPVDPEPPDPANRSKSEGVGLQRHDEPPPLLSDFTPITTT